METIVFVSASSSRRKYYRLIAGVLASNDYAAGVEGDEQLLDVRAKVISGILPGLLLLRALFSFACPFSITLDSQELDVHFRRQKINYSKIYGLPILAVCVRILVVYAESVRLRYFVLLFKRMLPTVVCVWNGQKFPYSTIAQAAKFCGARVVYFENGLLPDTTTVDGSGVNARASLPKGAQFYRDYLAGSSGFPVEVLDSAAQMSERAFRGDAGEKVGLPAEYVFVPFQINSDTQTIVNSPWVEGVEHLFELLVGLQDAGGEAGSELAGLSDLVFKEHPHDRVRYPKLHGKNFKGCFANAHKTQDLIVSAKYVVTVNSTVGLEAILLGRPVVVLGDAVYGVEGLVLKAANRGELFEALVLAEGGWQCDAGLRKAFILYLQQVYCIAGSWKRMAELPKSHFESVAKRILLLDKHSKHTFFKEK